MNVAIFDALAEGLKRTLTKNGLLLALATYALYAVYILFLPMTTGFEVEQSESIVATPPVGVPVAVGAAVAAVSMLLTAYVAIVAYRTFATDETETIPRSAVRDHPVWAYLNFGIGSIAFLVLITIGWFLLLIPGLFVMVVFWFYGVVIAVENKNFVSAMARSWRLTRGNRLRLFVLGFVFTVIYFSIVIASMIPQLVLGGVMGSLVGQLGIAFAVTFALATTAAAYTQLRTGADSATPT